MNKTYRLIWNHRLNAWIVASELTRASGKKASGRTRAGFAAVVLALSTSLPLAAADLSPGALPTGGTVVAGQADIAASGTRMDITQGSQKAIINWQGFDIGSQAQVNFAQPNASAVALNRVSGPTATRIEGQLTANGQVFLINSNGVLFGNGARVNAGAFVASTLNIGDDDFLAGKYTFTGTGGAIENQGAISAVPGGYVAFIAPKITNAGTLSAPQGTVAMGAGERVTLNFAGDRLVGLSVAAETLDTLIENRQAIRAEGGAILLTAAGAEAVTRSVINNSGVLEAGSLTADGGRIVLTAGNDINLGAGSSVAVDGKKGGEIRVQAQSGTLFADGNLSARGASGTGGSVQLLGRQVGLVNAAQVDASGATGGGTLLVGGDYQGKNTNVQNASRTYVSAGATIKADALDRGDGGKVVVWADEITRYYGSISAKGGSQGGNGGFVEVSGKRDLEFLGAVDVAAPMGTGGRVLLDPQDIVLNTTTQPAPPNNPNGTPDVAFADPPAAGTTTIQITDITGFSELYLQATRDITVSNPVTMAVNNSIRLEANNNITLVNGATAANRGSIATSGTGSITLKADADGSGSGNLVMNNATLTSNVGGITISGASISGSGAITATGAASTNGGNIGITGTSATGNITLTGAITTSGGTAAAGTPGRNAGNVTITGAGAVTIGAITANGSNGSGANQAGGNGGAIAVTSNGTLTTGNLAASGGNGVATAAGGNAGSITVTNNSTTAGTLTTGTLTARAGAAAGAIVSGAAGSVYVTNKATTLLQTGAINTSGQAGGGGGNVALTSAGGVTVTSTIATGGGTLNATTSAAGRNAGNVTIKAVNRSVAGSITASGGAAIVAGQAGGAGGNVQITGTDGTIATAGTLSTTGITARSGNAVGTVASSPAGTIALDATQITATGALNTTGGNNGAGGNIALTSTGTLNINGAIATTGGTANASSAGRNAGSVTISGAGVTSTAAGTITASGSGAATTGSSQPGGAGGAIQVISTNGIALGAAVTASGGTATTTNANGGNAGSIAINNSGSGNISTTTLTAGTGAATGTGNGGSAGFISVTNTAASGNLTTTGITTTGGAKGNGGNVTLSAQGALSTSNSSITTSGGAGIGSAGRNAGNVTIIGGGVNLGTGTVTANGGNGNGADQAGGNGATVQITSTNGITANGAINATGGNGVTGNAAGGNSGSINIANSVAGTVQTAVLVARNGAATGTGVGGAVGGITVSNTAGNVTLGALTTSGQASGSGGNISANATGVLTLNGAIASSGGANVAATTQAGKNAGTVSLSGNGGITAAAAATIAANGSAGLGGNQAGGNAGAVSLASSAGAISARAIASQTGAATGSGAGGTVGGITLNGTSVTTNAGALTTTGGANGNGGNITATASTGLLNVGAITTTGGAANANTAGKNAGAVTLTGASVTTLGITANGTNGTTNGAGGNGGNVSVTGTANTVSVGAISTIGGNGVGGNSAGGNAGTITLDAGATIPTITLGGNLIATGGSRVGTGTAGTGGQIWLKDAVLLNAAAITVSAQGGSAGVGTGANIRFDGATNSTGGARALTVNTNAATIFGGAVGGVSALLSLTTNATGTTQINGGAVTTTGAQTYNDAVTLGANTTLSAGAGTTVTAGAAMDLNGFTLGTAGTNLTLNGTGVAAGGALTNSSATAASYTGLLTLGSDSSIVTNAGDINITNAGTIGGAFGLTLGGSGNGSISSIIGTGTLTKAGTGTWTLGGVNTYTGATNINAGTLAVTANNALGTTAAGTTVASGAMLDFRNVPYATAEAVTLNGGTLATSIGTSNFAGPVTLGANSNVDVGGTQLTLSGAISGTGFGIAKEGSGTLVLSGTNTYTGATNINAGMLVAANAAALGGIGGGTNVGSNARLRIDGVALGAEPVTLNGLGLFNQGAITSNGAASLAGPVTLAADAAIAPNNGSMLTLSGPVDGAFGLTTGGFGTLNLNGAVGGVTPLAFLTTLATAPSSATRIGTSVRTTGNQTYNNPTTLGAGAALQSTGGNISLNGVVTASGAVSLQAAGDLLFQNSGSFGTLAATAGGTVTLGPAGQLAATGTGDAIVLSGSRFVNSAGAGALTATNGRWLVWSSNSNPFGGATPDNRGGLAYGFKQYNATYGVTPVQGAGNGFLYTVAPIITPSLTGTVSKVYDGNNTAMLAPANLIASGAVDGDSVVLAAASAIYDSRNVGTGKTVTATGITASASNGTAAVYGYTVSPSSASGPVGEITPAALTVSSIGAVSTTYGTPAATGAVSLNGVISGDSVTSTASLVGPTYSTSGNLSAGSYAQSAGSLGGADAGNYTLTAYTTPTNNYSVGQLALTGAAIAASGSTYGSALNPGAVTFGNVIAGDVVTSTAGVNTSTLSSSGNPIVGNYTQTAGAIGGTDAANYSFGGYTTPAANYTIGQAALSVAGIAGVSTTYGTPAATGAVSLNGVISGDSVTSTASLVGPTYSTSGNLSAGSYAQSAGSLGGADAGNYTLTAYTTPTNNYSVGQLALTGSILASDKVYDSTTAAIISSRSLSGVIVGDSVSYVGGIANFSDKNVGAAKTVTGSGLGLSGADAGNYTVNSVASTTASITPAPLTLNAVSDTKVYDGTTGSSGVVGTVGLQGSDSVGNLSQSYASKNVLGTNASTLAVNGGYIVNDGNGGANYSVTTTTAKGTISPAPLTIAANDASKLFGTPNPPFTATYSGFVGGETPSVLNGALSFQTVAGTTSPPGNYAITPYGQTSSNYAIVFRDGVLTINGSPSGPGDAGATGADQQAIGAQYTSQGAPTLALAMIQYIRVEGDCLDETATPHGSCAGQPPGTSLVRVVNGGISMPRQ